MVQRGKTAFKWFGVVRKTSFFVSFLNPITDKGYTLDSGIEVGQSLIARANDVTNEWSL